MFDSVNHPGDRVSGGPTWWPDLVATGVTRGRGGADLTSLFDGVTIGSSRHKRQTPPLGGRRRWATRAISGELTPARRHLNGKE